MGRSSLWCVPLALTVTLCAACVLVGNEANYLRAQIARITAGTTVHPLGFYSFDEDEDEEEGRENFIVDEEYEGKSRSELLAPDLSGWGHHAQYILPQGRCKWVNKAPEHDQGEDVAAEEEEDELGAATVLQLVQPV